MKDTIKLTASVRMIAHRGLSGLERENTSAAFVAAGNRSYYGIETDVHRTADGQFIIIHDDSTLRMTGVDCMVEETALSDLREMHMTDLDGNARADLLFPTLAEYIGICRKYEKEAVLELKNHMHPEDIDRIITIIRDFGWLNHVIFISFDWANCLCIRERLPMQRVQFLTSQVDEALLDHLAANRLDLDAWYGALTPEYVAACHMRGIAVNVWTVDAPEDGQRMAAMGVDFITSNILEATRKVMSCMQNDPKRPRPIPAIRAEDYDRINGDEETASAYEPTYRDGSVRHECWGPGSDRYADDER